ncbi:thiamine phosphate synthase, partial [Hominenteromicrobium sp.]
MKFDPTLYLVTDSTGRTDDDFLSILEKALTGGVTLVQLREKERGGGEYLRLARLTKAVCDRYRVPLIIDDRADIAMAADAAGVHVGQSDLPVCEARKLLGEDKIVGATAKT